MDDYKEGMKLTPEEIEAIKPTQEECAEITAAMELYKPPEFKGCFANDEHNKLTKRKVSDAAQEKCLRVLSSMELSELPIISNEKRVIAASNTYLDSNCVDDGDWYVAEAQRDADLAIIQPIIAAQIGYREILRDDVVQLQNELDKQIVENEGLKAQLSTARAEIAKELYEEFICPMCYRLNPQHAEMDNGVGCKTCANKESYLAPDKEGGK